jgi:hypothetical protein
MTSFSIIIALAASVLLLTAGYLFGVRRGYRAREYLRELMTQQKQALSLAHHELDRKVEQREQGVRSAIEQALAPLINREQLSIDLANLKTGGGQRDLTLLLDRIAEAGNFSTVALSDSEGLALAGNSASDNLDRIAVNSSFVLLAADRISANHFPAPLSIIVHDVANQTTLFRIFEAQDRKFALTAVSTGAQLTPTTLDPALIKVSGVLAAKG